MNRFLFEERAVAGKMVHILRIDLRTKPIFVVTPCHDGSQMPSMKTSEFAQKYKVSYAINGDQFTYNPDGSLKLKGLACSNGNLYNWSKDEPTIYISKSNELALNKIVGKLWNAISGNHILINNGKIVQSPDGYIFPRTIVGWVRNYMFWVCVDGNEAKGTGMSLSGATLIMKSLGCTYALNMDGGGSSTMVGNGKILNVPSDNNVAGQERSVANHLGVI